MDLTQASPLTFDLSTYLWVIGLSAWGGVVNYYRKYRCCEIDGFSFMEMFAEISTASFAGVLTFFSCYAMNFTSLFTVVMVGVSGHMGSRSVTFFEHMLQDKLFNRHKNEPPPQNNSAPLNNTQYYQYPNFNLSKEKLYESDCSQVDSRNHPA